MHTEVHTHIPLGCEESIALIVIGEARPASPLFDVSFQRGHKIGGHTFGSTTPAPTTPLPLGDKIRIIDNKAKQDQR